MAIVDNVRDKLEEYGLKIFNDYLVEDSEHVFYVENMILFVDKSDDSIGVSFQATTKAEKAANMSLILNETGYELNIMEAFIYDKNNQCITGNEAYELIKNTDKAEAVKEYMKEQAYTHLLMSTPNECGYEC